MPQDLFERAIVMPLPEALVDRFARVDRAIWRLSTESRDTVEHLAIIPPGTPHTLRR